MNAATATATKPKGPKGATVEKKKGFKFEAPQDQLQAAIAAVGKVVSAKSTLPVLANLALAVEGDAVTFTGTNLDLTIVHRMPATVREPGSTTLPAKLLGDYVALLDKAQPTTISFLPKTSKAHVQAGKYEANVSTIPFEDFPPTPIVSGEIGFTIPAATIKKALGQVTFCAAPDDTRPVLAGVLMVVEGTELTLAAADGFRLAVRKVDLDDGAQAMRVIVPAGALNEVERLVPDGDEKVAVTVSATHASFAFGNTTVLTRLIEGEFPDYARIIPDVKNVKTTITISTSDMLRAVKAAAVFARDNSNIIRVGASEGSGELGQVKIESTSAEMGDTEGELEAVVDGIAAHIAFNGKYLRDVLEVLETPNLALRVTNASSPGLFQPAGTTEKVLYVVMPMHVAERGAAAETNGHGTATEATAAEPTPAGAEGAGEGAGAEGAEGAAGAAAAGDGGASNGGEGGEGGQAGGGGAEGEDDDEKGPEKGETDETDETEDE
jgi:DNA polymerase III subunit beta